MEPRTMKRLDVRGVATALTAAIIGLVYFWLIDPLAGAAATVFFGAVGAWRVWEIRASLSK